MRISIIGFVLLVAVGADIGGLPESVGADNSVPDGAIARLGTPVRSDHHQAVAIAFSPDDTIVACAGLRTQVSRDVRAHYPIEVFHTDTMRRVVVFEGATRPIVALQIAADKKRLVSLDEVGTVQLWDTISGERLWTASRMDPVEVVFAADKKHIFAAARFGQVWILDRDSGDVIQEHNLATPEPQQPGLMGPPGGFGGGGQGEKRTVRMEFSQEDGTMTVIEEGKPPVKLDLRAMVRKKSFWRRIRFLPDGKTMSWLNDERSVEIRDVVTNEVVTDPKPGTGVAVRRLFSEQDKELSVEGLLWPAANLQSFRVRIVDVVSFMDLKSAVVQKTLFSWPPPASWLEGDYSLSPDIPEKQPRGQGKATMAWFADSLAVSPDGTRVALMGRRIANRSEARVLDLERETTLRTFALESRYRERELYGGRIHATPQIRSFKPVTGTFSHDGKRLAVEMMGEIRLLDVDTGREVIGENRVAEGDEPILQEHEDKIAAIVFSPDGKLVATASYDSTVRLWNASTGKELLRREHEWLSASQYAIAFSPDSTLLAADLGNKVEILRCSDGETVCRLEGKAVTSVAAEATAVGFSPDGTRLATWRDSGRLLTWWELPSGRQIKAIRMELLPEDKPTEGPTHTDDGALQSFAFSPDMRRLAITAYLDRVLIQFDTWTGERLHQITSRGRLAAPCFSADMKRFVVGGDGEPFRVFATESGKQVDRIVPGGRRSDELMGDWMNPHYDQRIGIGAGSGAERPQLFLDQGQILTTVDLTMSRFYNVESGRLIGELPDYEVRAVSADGQRVATVTDRNWTSPHGDLWPMASTVLIWNTEELPVQLRPR